MSQMTLNERLENIESSLTQLTKIFNNTPTLEEQESVRKEIFNTIREFKNRVLYLENQVDTISDTLERIEKNVKLRT